MNPRTHFPRCIALLLTFALTSVSPAMAQWPQWGGPRMDFKAEASGLASTWPETGPKEIWKRDLGDGYSSILVDGERLYTMYRSADDVNEIVIALDAGTGKTIWEHKYEKSPAKGHADQFGRGPRSTPLIVGDRIFSIGVSGTLTCLNKNDGKAYWTQELWDQFGGNVLQHGYSSSPIAHKDMVIVLVGGEGASLVAFKQSDGSVVWKKHDFKNSYSTPKLIDLDGQPQLVTFMNDRIVGIDPDKGDLRWEYEFEGTNMAQPVWYADDNILFLSALGVGARGLKLTRKADGTQVEEVWSTRKVQFYHVNPIAVGDHVYGSTGNGPCFFVSIHHKTGEIAWRKRGFAKATAVYADDKFIVLDEDGQLGLVRATPESFEVLAKVSLLEKVAWTVPTVIGNRMYVRDKKTIRALDLS